MILVMLSPLLIIFFIVLSILEERKRTKKKQLEKEKANTLNQNTNDTESPNQELSLQQAKEQKDDKG
ncbi:TPA: hypothetical protein SH062_000885 [Staphylococcus aureus]|nr:hypothetical protein [Staphylococcus aureus]